MRRQFHILDVFTDRRLAGNPLAVVLEADGLDDQAMQRIAGEFNLSETVFVLPPENPAHTARVRIFTPQRELPFAGHPTVGTAVCLAADRFGAPVGEQDAVIVLEEKIGPVRCGVRLNGKTGFAEFDLPQLPRPIGEPAEGDRAAAALGLDPRDLGFENHRPSRWSSGLAFHFVPVRDRGALARASPASGAFDEAFGETPAFVYTRDTEGHDHSFRARMFAPQLGVREDPATGSAVSALAGPVHVFDALRDGQHKAIVEQGYEMGRPSLIRLEVVVGRGRLQTVRIGGDAVSFASGTLAGD